jgi:hypothetical protein
MGTYLRLLRLRPSHGGSFNHELFELGAHRTFEENGLEFRVDRLAGNALHRGSADGTGFTDLFHSAQSISRRM